MCEPAAMHCKDDEKNINYLLLNESSFLTSAPNQIGPREKEEAIKDNSESLKEFTNTVWSGIITY